MIDFFSYEKNSDENRVRMYPVRRNDKVPEEWLDLPSDGCSCKSCLSRLHRDEIPIPARDYCYPVGIKTSEPKQDHFYFLCDDVLRGYALNERRWGKIPFILSTISPA
jgi:hypothetical protein